MEAVEIPLLGWSSDEDGIHISKDSLGYLHCADDGTRPLLLRSTVRLMEMLYPGSSMDENKEEWDKILLGPLPELPKPEPVEPKGEEDEEPAEKSSVSDDKYAAYQQLQRANNLSYQIESVLLDIHRMRQRKLNDKEPEKLSRLDAKVRALEHQQSRLAAQQQAQSSDDIDNSDENNTGEETGDGDDDGEADGGGGDEEQDGNGEDVSEPDHCRIVRTINSLRLVASHLVPMLKHKFRNDKKLKIGEEEFKKKKKKPMCWLLGRRVFDVASKGMVENHAASLQHLLASYILPELADAILTDKNGSPEYFSKNWIRDIRQRASPAIINPLQLLPETNRENMRESAVLYDDKFLHRKASNIPNAQARYSRSISMLHDRLTRLFRQKYPDVRLSIYGSCLSDLSLGHGADVDISLWLPEIDQLKKDFKSAKISASAYEKKIKSYVFNICRTLERRQQEFADMVPVHRARVPVVKGTYLKAQNPYCEDGTIHFDICFMNDIAVANSSLIREYSLVHPKVKDLMMGVKRWSKEYGFNSAMDKYISSYAWINMVIFYLQCLGIVPSLQSEAIMEASGFVPNPKGNFWHFVNDLETYFVTWREVQTSKAFQPEMVVDEIPVSVLLLGFFHFYSIVFPVALFAASIKLGNISLPRSVFRKRCQFICIEDPFETHDSYCPHDLGIPSTDRGAQEMTKAMLEAMQHMKDALSKPFDDNARLWPEAPQKPEKDNDARNGGSRRKGNNRRRNANKQGGEGNANAGKKQNGDGNARPNATGRSQGRGRGRGRGGRGGGGRGGGRGNRGRGQSE